MKKLNILYDASIICNILTKNSARSGIFFTGYNILLEFLKRPEFNIYLYSDDIAKLKRVLDTYPELHGCEIFKISLLNNITFFFRYKSAEYKENGNFLGRYVAGCVFWVLKLLNKYWMANFVRIKNIDIYFSPMKAVPEFIRKNKSIKKYTVLHDTIPLINDYGQGKIPKWYYKLVNSINSEDKYFANSFCTKQDFIEYVPEIKAENITVIPLSTGKPYSRIEDTSYISGVKQKYKIPADKKYIFSLCSLNPRKNLVFAIKNFLEFVEKNNLEDFVFVLGGSHDENFEDILNKNIKNLGKRKDKILRIGYVDDDDMSALYSGAEMFIYASLYEGFGMPVLEAMKCGLPVICSNVTSIPEVIGDCGIKINPYSDEELISAMEKMYFDRDFREDCIKKGLERAKMFTWEKCVDVISDRIKKDLNFSRGGGISLVYICDESYVMPTCVSIQSVYENKKNSVYDIYIIGVDLSPKSISKIKSINLSGINIKLIQFDNKYEKLNTSHDYVSKAALFKFELPNILKDLDKVLYIDSDTICNGDLAEFFNTDLENFYAGVVRDFPAYYCRKDYKEIGLNDYFNSGVMLLNLKKLRESDIPNKLLQYKLNSKSVRYMDQDCFNVIFNNKVSYLNPKYNYMVSAEYLYMEHGFEDIKPLIIHMTTGRKPWKLCSVPYAHEWYFYFKKSIYKYCFLQRYLLHKEKIDNKRNIYFGGLKVLSYKK